MAWKYTKAEIKTEKKRRRLLSRFRSDPLFWLQHRFCEDPSSFRWSSLPGYEHHEWDGDADPLVAVWEAIARGEDAGLLSATATGKTYFLARVVFWFLDVFPDSLVVTTAPKQDQLKLHLWSEISKSFHKFKAIRPDAELLNLSLAVDYKKAKREARAKAKKEALTEPDFSDSWIATGFVAGQKANEESSTKAQGFHRKHMLIIVEETPGVPAPVLSAFENTATGQFNPRLMVGNPDNELDNLCTYCDEPGTFSARASAYDHPNVVLHDDIIPGAVSIPSIDKRKLKYGEGSGFFQSRVRGIAPKESSDSLIKLSWIEACIGEADPELALTSYAGAGLDIANSEAGDLGVAAYGVGGNLKFLKAFQCENATHLAYNVYYGSAECSARGYANYGLPNLNEYGIWPELVGVDAVGVGVATVNAFHDMGLEVQSLQGGPWEEAIPLDEHERPLYRFNSLRTQMWWELREDVRSGAVRFAIDDHHELEQLKKELTLPKFSAKAGVLGIESKEEIKRRLGGRSPDRADGVVYWNWARKGYRFQIGGIGL